jgi:alpha-L-rhamnosidase
MLHYVEYMVAHSENGLVFSDEPGRWCLGDWCTAESIAIPEPFVNTYFLIKSINRLLEIAEMMKLIK